jgi:hypothetical protein
MALVTVAHGRWPSIRTQDAVPQPSQRGCEAPGTPSTTQVAPLSAVWGGGNTRETQVGRALRVLTAVVEGAADALTADAPRLAEIMKLTLAALAVDTAPVRKPAA